MLLKLNPVYVAWVADKGELSRVDKLEKTNVACSRVFAFACPCGRLAWQNDRRPRARMDTCGGVARDIAWPLCRVNARDELRCLAAQIHCKNAFWRCETPIFRRAARGKFSTKDVVINSVSVRTRGRSLRSSNPNYDSRFARRGGREHP